MYFTTIDYRISSKFDSYTSSELESYIYALPLMKFLTAQNIVIQQDSDLFRITDKKGFVLEEFILNIIVGIVLSSFFIFVILLNK